MLTQLSITHNPIDYTIKALSHDQEHSSHENHEYITKKKKVLSILFNRSRLAFKMFLIWI